MSRQRNGASRRTVLKKAGAAAGAALAMTQVGQAAAAQDDGTPGIVGTWIVNGVPLAPTGVPNSTFVNFIPGGGFTRGGISHPTESPGFGAWRQVAESEFEFTYQVDQFDKTGTFVGYRKAWARMTVDPSGMTWSGMSRGLLTDVNGKETRTGPGGLRGERMVAEPFEAG
jgi:hypothetical protein